MPRTIAGDTFMVNTHREDVVVVVVVVVLFSHAVEGNAVLVQTRIGPKQILWIALERLDIADQGSGFKKKDE